MTTISCLWNGCQVYLQGVAIRVAPLRTVRNFTMIIVNPSHILSNVLYKKPIFLLTLLTTLAQYLQEGDLSSFHVCNV
jgi:hypothetical protein